MDIQIQDIAKKLIRFKTVKDNLKEHQKALDFIIDYFKDEKVFIKKFKHNNINSLVITLKKEKNPKVILNGHIDVIEASNKDFIPKIKNQRIYGRGAGDMKGQVAVIMKIIKDLSRLKTRPSVGLMLTFDEEKGGFDGVNYLLKEKGYKPNLAIVLDGGGELKNIVCAQKGVLHLSVSTKGKSAHGSRPYLGENAVEKLIDIYYKIRKIIPKSSKAKWENTLNLGIIKGGEATNQVPDYAQMNLDIRLVENKKRILNLIKKITDFEIIAEGIYFKQNTNKKAIKLYKEIAEKELKKKISFYKEEGSSDARFFAEKGIDVIITQAKMKNHHSENEWVDIKELNQLYNILFDFLQKFDKPK